jgi:hypothetical protein
MMEIIIVSRMIMVEVEVVETMVVETMVAVAEDMENTYNITDV